MKKKLLVVIPIVGLLAVGISYFVFVNKQADETIKESFSQEVVEEKKEETVSLTLDFGDEDTTSYTIPFTQNSTAFGVLKETSEKENIPLETQQYDFGVFVESINGFEGSAEMAWIYFVNGESGQVAADQYELSPGDVVEWKYIEPSL